MIKLAFMLALMATAIGVASAQQPAIPGGWHIVLKNFLGRTQAVLPQSYQTKNQCDVARVQAGYSEFQITGVHGKCLLFFGGRLHRR